MKKVQFSIDRSRGFKQVPTTSIKGIKLPADTILTLRDFQQQDTDNGEPNDYLVFVTDKGQSIKVPVREYMKFTTPEGDVMYDSEGNDKIEFHNVLTVKSSKDRLTNEGDPSLSLQHYALIDEMMAEGGEFNYRELLEGGWKPGVKEALAAGKITPIQDYEVSIG